MNTAAKATAPAITARLMATLSPPDLAVEVELAPVVAAAAPLPVAAAVAVAVAVAGVDEDP